MGEKQEFSGKAGFILAAVGSAVGLGNIWRFPYVVYSSGGGAFFLPYLIAIFVAGIPLLILEYSLGHSRRQALPGIMASVRPKMAWLGWWPAIASGFILCYYSMILGWSVNYFVLSFGQGWGQDSDGFFHNAFLRQSAGPTQLGGMLWYVLAGIALLWLLGYLICSRGIKKGLERINRILLPLLLVIMVIITLKSLTMEGATQGLTQLFTPDFSSLLNPSIWLSAFGQVFFSLSLASGIMMTFSSYLPPKNDINGSAFMTAFANCGFELLSAVGVFSILGVMMHSEGVPMEEVAQSGVGLAFVVFPRFFTETETGFLGILFFLCLIFAGLTSSVSMIESLSAPITEKFKITRKKTAAIICLSGLCISAIFATEAGLYILNIADHFISSYSIVTVGLIEAVVGGYLIGAQSLREYSNRLSLFRVGRWWDICIKYIVPLGLTATLVQSLIGEILLPFGGYTRLDTLLYGWGALGLILITAILLARKRPRGA